MQFFLIGVGLFNIFLCKILKKGWFNPAMIYTLVWTAFVVVPCFLWNDIDWDFEGLIWITFSCTSVIVGQGLSISFTRRKRLFGKEPKKKEILEFIHVSCLKKIVSVLILASLVYIAYGIVRKGFSLSVFYNLDQLFAINNYSAYNRYNTEESASVLNQIFLIIEYSLPLFGGMLVHYARDKNEKIFAITTLLPVALALIISNAKAGFIASIINFFASYMLSYYLIFGCHKKISAKSISIAIAAIVLFIGILFISMCMRVGNFELSTINYVKHRIMTYAFGQMKAFDEWFVTHSSLDYSLGTSTYMWIFNRLGIVTRVQGVYGYASSIRTNVFTVFRGIISDFGIVGGQAYLFFRGMLTGYLNEKFEKSKKVSVLLFALLLTNYQFILYGFIISPWTYTTYALMYVFFIIIIKISKIMSV